MALKQLLQLPISRICISSNPIGFTLFSIKFIPHSPQLPVRWVRACALQPDRSFTAFRLEKSEAKKKKRRLDEVCLERFEQYSRTFIQSWITQGKVTVDGRVVNKCGTPVSDKSIVEIKAEVPKYVCRAGHKLEAAIEQLEINVTGKVILDSGLSTGGFTDCLLQYGASFVYGVDVGYGQVADKIRRDARVMPAVIGLMKDDGTLVSLIKPQFEAHRSQVGSGGIVRDPLVHQEVLVKIINGVEKQGFQCRGWIESPLKGADGNKEFLACFDRKPSKDTLLPLGEADITKLYRCHETINVISGSSVHAHTSSLSYGLAICQEFAFV